MQWESGSFFHEYGYRLTWTTESPINPKKLKCPQKEE